MCGWFRIWLDSTHTHITSQLRERSLSLVRTTGAHHPHTNDIKKLNLNSNWIRDLSHRSGLRIVVVDEWLNNWDSIYDEVGTSVHKQTNRLRRLSLALSLGVLSNDEEMIKGGKKINQTNQLFFKNLFEWKQILFCLQVKATTLLVRRRKNCIPLTKACALRRSQSARSTDLSVTYSRNSAEFGL